MKNISVSKVELCFYFIFWKCSIFYAIYSVAIAANEYFLLNKFEDTYEDFSSGWSWLHRLKDNSDTEWKYFKILAETLFPWCLIHLIVAEFLRHYYHNLIIYWYTTISFMFIVYNFGLKMILYYTFQPLFGYLALQFKSKTIIWFYYAISLILINYLKWLNFEIYNLYNFSEIITTNAIFWINLRSLNYFLDVINLKESCKFTFKNLCTIYAYCLYLPYLFIGPLISFTDFKLVFDKFSTKHFQKRFKQLTIRLIRFIVWFIFIEFILHFVYVNALTFQPQVINKLNSWALYGAGYCMGQFFQLKYVVFYGLSTTLAQFEGSPIPSTPKCIGRIHLYSDMWKYFDRGLYLFLLKHIYIPLLGKHNNNYKKVLASFSCFLFVYFWHGLQNFVLIWSLLNFLGVTIETVCSGISGTVSRRLKCIAATPLFAMSAISNFYFFAGFEVGNIYARRFLQDSCFVSFNVLIILYFGSQVSTEIKLWEQSRKIK